MKQLIIDPPEGYLHGFPKPLPEGTEDTRAWLIAEGYPGNKIDAYGDHFHCRMWYQELTDTQRLDWLLRECEIVQLDENGARSGEDLMDRGEIDASMSSRARMGIHEIEERPYGDAPVHDKIKEARLDQ